MPDKTGVAGPFSGVSGNALIVAGGANFPDAMPWEGGKKIWHDAIYVLPGPKTEWKIGFTLPRPNGYGISITTAEGLVCIGGGDVNEHFTDVFLLKWEKEKITTKKLPPLPMPSAFGSGALLGNSIYVAGGIETPDATNTMHVFWSLDLSKPNGKWEELEPWPGPARMLAVAAAQDGSFFLAGGTDLFAGPDGKPQRTYLDDAFRYTPEKGWKEIAKMPRPAVAAPSPAPTIGRSHFLVMSGDDGSKLGFQPVDEHPGFPKEILAYHTITDTWTRMENAPFAHVTVPAVNWEGRIVIPSGEVRPGVRSPAIWSATTITQKSAFGTFDYITLAGYLGSIVLIGLYCSRRHQTTADFFLGGKRIPWWAAGISIFGTQLSAITFLAIPAKVYSTDWTYFLNNMMVVAITPIVVFFYLPFFRRLNVTTAYEYLEHRFNVVVRMFAAATFCILQMGRMGIVLFLPALALSAVTGINIYLCIVLMGVLTTFYSATGGIEAVIWTDLAQVAVLLLAAVVSLFLIASQVDGGFGTIVSTGIAEGKFHMVDWTWDMTTTSILVMTLGTWLSLFGPYSADQSVVQRYLTTPDEKQAAKSMWTNMILVVPATLLFFTVGTALYVFYKTHPEQLNPTLDTDAVFPWFISHSLPTGVVGLVIAGVFAAAMSSLDSSINSMSTVITTDFYRRARPNASDRTCLRLARTLTVLLGIAGTATALLMAGYNIKSLWDVFLRIIGLLGGGLAGVFVLGIFTRRANATGALMGLIASAVLLGWIQQNTRLHFFLFGGIGMVSCVVFGYFTSLFFGSKPLLSGKQLTIHSLFRSPIESTERRLSKK
ncbi:MAG: sodium/solute symporter [Verrucomicrobia bacterium]|nr:sodium/solute symporter [Verrucomicrobiota bacterium]